MQWQTCFPFGMVHEALGKCLTFLTADGRLQTAVKSVKIICTMPSFYASGRYRLGNGRANTLKYQLTLLFVNDNRISSHELPF